MVDERWSDSRIIVEVRLATTSHERGRDIAGDTGGDINDGLPASVVFERRIEWSETDPMGRWHYSTVLRLVEAAESLLHQRLGIEQETFPRMPRVHLEVSFTGPLHYAETAEVRLRVDRIGRSSLRYAFEVLRHELPASGAGAGPQPAAHGTMTVVWYDLDGSTPAPWPERLRTLLGTAGPLPPSPHVY
jgi:acyl-CoA thioester hydrolase